MRRNVQVLFAVLVYVVVANVPLWLASRFLDFSVIGLFNIEFVAIGILSLYAGRRLSVCLLLSAIILDLIYSIGKTYLLTPVELFASASSGLLYLPSHIWSLTAVAFATLAVCLLAAMTGSDEADRTGRRRTVYMLAGIALLGLAVDGSRGRSRRFALTARTASCAWFEILCTGWSWMRRGCAGRREEFPLERQRRCVAPR